jgi:hypothetical protein
MSRKPGGDVLIGAIEMRTAQRYLILQRAFAYPAGAAPARPWRSVAFDVSVGGIGITLPVRLARGTLLTIQAWNLPGAPVLQARVARANQVASHWFTGCELLTRLSDAGLRAWRSGEVDWLDSLDEARPA